jgi:hypothetical protein
MPVERDLFAEVIEWTSVEPRDDRIVELYHRFEFLAASIDAEYEPTRLSSSRFMDRLAAFVLTGGSNADRQSLYFLAAEILFVTELQLSSLLRTALEERAIPWLAEKSGTSFADAEYSATIDSLIAKTWFLPMTDSFPIAQFYHENRITGAKQRPDVRGLAAFADSHAKLAKHIAKQGYENVVILEDFIGSGVQSGAPLTFALGLPANVSVLVIPLVICWKGLAKVSGLLAPRANAHVSPVIVFDKAACLTPTPSAGQPASFAKFRELLNRIDGQVNADADVAYPGPFGFESVGALVCQKKNCPNNTVSAIHFESSSWHPPLPRSIR